MNHAVTDRSSRAVYNPWFAAMEITTLARAFPERLLPGLGHGVGPWMAQIGAAPPSALKAIQETVTAVRPLFSAPGQHRAQVASPGANRIPVTRVAGLRADHELDK